MRNDTLTRVLGALCGVALCACNPTVFSDLEDDANILVAEAPDGYARGGFGSVIASYGGLLGGVPVSRLAASADADSQVRVYAAWTGTTIRIDPAAYDVCEDAGDCETGAGASLSGVRSWRGEGLCVAIGAPTSDIVLVRCEDSPTMAIERVNGPAGTRFGASIAGLPSGDLLVGAPMGGTGGVGTVYLADALSGVTELSLSAARTTGVTRVGAQVAAAPTVGGGAIAAITASGSTQRRVIVVELDGAGTATLLACLDDTDTAFGAVVAVGDIDGDGVPDVAVADDAGLPGRHEHVRIYDGADLRSMGGACVMPTPAPTQEVDCMTARGVLCPLSGFGTSLAIGDVDGDGDGDLAVGAPNATFNGVANSGAVWLIPGNGTTLDAAAADVLTDSEPALSSRLGTSVAMVETRENPEPEPSSPPLAYQRRSEVAAGAPGAAQVFVFACSGLPGDGVTAGPRCIPAASGP